MSVRILRLVRMRSGDDRALGHVADAVVFAGGPAVLRWLTAPAAVELYPTEADMRTARESSGRSRFEVA